MPGSSNLTRHTHSPTQPDAFTRLKEGPNRTHAGWIWSWLWGASQVPGLDSTSSPRVVVGPA